MPEPLVSVVMTVYNGERFLAEAIESVLGQTWARKELILVDDGSSDGSADVASSYPVRFLRQENRGVAAARNAGIEAARGELVSLIDQDDAYMPTKLERQVEALADRPDAGACVCRMEFYLEPGCPVPDWMEAPLVGTSHHTWQVGCLLIRRETFAAVGTFDESYRWGNDSDWFVRLSDAGIPLAMIDETLLRYRIHDENESSKTREMMREQLRVFHASVRRKREAAGGG